MLIGVSGKIGSGKDTVGEIVQIISASPHFTDEAVLSFIGRQHLNSKWEIRKFADKLKDMACMLLGCSREQLEDRKFKEKELGEEWWYWKIFGYNGTNPNGNFILIPYDNSEPDKYDKVVLIKTTPRLILQLLGTECGRQIIHPNIWVNALMSEYKNLNSSFSLEDGDALPVTLREQYPNWIITDMRFPNELKAVKDKGGITIRVNRFNTCNCGNSTDWKYDTIKDGSNRYCGVCSTKQTIKDEHESETSLDSAIFDYTIENEGELVDLVSKVRKIMLKERLWQEKQ